MRLRQVALASRRLDAVVKSFQDVFAAVGSLARALEARR